MPSPRSSFAVGVPVVLRGVGTSDGTVTTPFPVLRTPRRAGVLRPPTEDDADEMTPSLTGGVHGPGYACGGEQYLRGFAAAALLPTDALRRASRPR